MATKRKIAATRRRRRKKTTDEESELPLPLIAGILASLQLVGGLMGACLLLGLYVDVHYVKFEFLHEPWLESLLTRRAAVADSGIVGFYAATALFTALGILSKRRWAWATTVLFSLFALGRDAVELVRDLPIGDLNSGKSGPSGMSVGSDILGFLISLALVIYWVRPAVSEAFV